jgi:hypothetical protein
MTPGEQEALLESIRLKLRIFLLLREHVGMTDKGLRNALHCRTMHHSLAIGAALQSMAERGGVEFVPPDGRRYRGMWRLT